MIRFAFLLAGLAFTTSMPVFAQSPVAPASRVASVAADEPVPRTERAKARQDCLAEHVALSGDDLRAAMRDCMQAKFPGVQLYARDGLTRDGKPTAVATRAACKTEIDAQNLAGSTRTAALIACFNAKRPDLAQRAECRKDARGKGLDGEDLRKAVEACAREARS
ncbi:hypothetical protein IP69_19110 [Bosea sp. AAP35]|uniref:hypothetical protein n=1 Tax=Bosea sp. AAP35 TaxID=1523417 RepID=UPI0006B99E15|nr:hypothetical protein [Bosea sp. AAP35]KPF63481.1 hypothetical protein IP69_19110 [Bosea sp. AAP35]